MGPKGLSADGSGGALIQKVLIFLPVSLQAADKDLLGGAIIKQSSDQSQQHLPGLGLGLEGRAPDHDPLHVDMAHLKGNTCECSPDAAKSISGDRLDGVAKSLQLLPTLGIYTGGFSLGKIPPQVFFQILIFENNRAPTGQLSALAKVRTINQ